MQTSGTKRKRSFSQFNSPIKKFKTLKSTLNKPTVASKQYVKRQIRKQQELKYYSNSGNVTVDYSGAVYPLTNIPQGDSDTARDGDAFIPTSIQLRYNVTVADATNLVRVMVVRYNNYISGDISVNSVLQTIGSFEAPITAYSFDNRQNFTVIYDKCHALDTYNSIQSVDLSLPLAKKTVQYAAASSTAGTNRYWLLVISDSAAATHPSIKYYIRVQFTDS